MKRLVSLLLALCTTASTLSAQTTTQIGTGTQTPPSLLESGGVPLASVTMDIDGNVRNASTPDIGADEFGVPTPITLLSFTGKKYAGINRLTWETANEMNNAGFELQRSADGNLFDKIGFVRSKNSNGVQQYSFDDLIPLKATNYYRLKQLDKNGSFAFSKTVVLKRDIKEVEIISVYPNPAKDVLNITVEAPLTQKIIASITDLTGKVLIEQTIWLAAGNQRLEIPVSPLAQGTYFVRIDCEDGCETLVQTFIKK